MGFNYGFILACYGPCLSHDLLRGLRRGLRHGLLHAGGGGMLTKDIEASRWSNVCVLMGLGVYQCLSHHISHHPSVSTHTILSPHMFFFLRISHQKINPQIPRSTVIITHHKNPKKMVALSSLKK